MSTTPLRAAAALLLLSACSGGGDVRHNPRERDTASDTTAGGDSSATDTSSAADDTSGDADTSGGSGSPCPAEMAYLELPGLDPFCMDRYEAPGVEGGQPLVMYTLLESEDWCEARGKRLCYDDEWERTCEGAAGTSYPYGDTHAPGVCNDEEIWRVYSQSELSAWPSSASSPDIEDLDALLAAAAALNASASEHVASLYQGEGGGENADCVNENGVYDLVGNVEEWTLRRDGGTTDFHGNLKGRYWSEARTCQSDLTSHGDGFRFYEIGFRCCRDL